MKFEAVIFDLDGVITDTAEYHYQSWKQLSDELGMEFDRELNEQLKGVSRLDSLEVILLHNKKADMYTAEQKEALAETKNQHYVSLIQKVSPDDILPGIKDLIDRLRTQKIPLALASVSKNAMTVMDGLGLTSAFDMIVDANTIKNSKPDPEVFLRAAEGIGVAADTCIGIEDAIAGVTAIKAAGMYAIAIGDSNNFSHADEVYPDTLAMSQAEVFRAIT